MEENVSEEMVKRTRACFLPVHLGRLFYTAGVANDIEEDRDFGFEVLVSVLHRHKYGDWGEIDPEDWGRNEEAMLTGARIFSVYEIGERKIWVITEADRSSTTVLYPEEY